MAGSVLVAVGDAWERLRPVLVERAGALTVGDGADPSVQMGPVISQAAASRIEGEVTDALADGARLGARRPRGAARAATPTSARRSSRAWRPEQRAAREEIFGPVLCVIEVGTLEEAIAVVNASPYGNGTSIFTESGAAARRYRSEVEVGMVGINVGVAAPVAFFPFSGWKGSFFGDLHAHGSDAVEFFTRKKTITTRWFSQESGRYFVE